ncbi:glycosyl transferase [Pseudoalteromonas sp. S201]|uniref:glycosyltransferase family 2 protein n=1 Tax=Pseudoalteromonas sp. S201 TaxID=579519 RepID=UPI00110D0B71|nr:glycosyltransferase family 2 protein [Pseudoalteromonas sp. S201]TMS92555.1 glycosyl transferase [Pseudoalteromonas sp. S201]
MKIEPLISVIIPLYNAENYILETLESVKSQTYQNIELIIVDNASTDNSLLLVREFINSLSHSNVKVIECEVNSGGPAKPRNLGIDLAEGEFIAFLDSDDVWHNEKLERQILSMLDNDLNFTSTRSFLIDVNNSPISNNKRVIAGKIKKYGIKKLLFSNTIVTSSVVIKAQLLNDFRFNDSANMVASEDYLLWLCILNTPECNFAELLDSLVDYRVLSNSLGSKSGKLSLAVKGLFASTQFIIETKQPRFLPLILLSNILRLTKLFLTRKYN